MFFRDVEGIGVLRPRFEVWGSQDAVPYGWDNTLAYIIPKVYHIRRIYHTPKVYIIRIMRFYTSSVNKVDTFPCRAATLLSQATFPLAGESPPNKGEGLLVFPDEVVIDGFAAVNEDVLSCAEFICDG